MNKINLSEIDNWEQFENLASRYFNEIIQLEENHLTEVIVNRTGIGPDGGRDILLTMRVNDSIMPFERKWVVQCKFYDKLKKSNLDKIDIPTLLEEYRADGYLLICKNSVTSGVTNTFDNLSRNCRWNRKYVIWNGSDFEERLYKTTDLHEHFFPEFYDYKVKRAKSIDITKILSE
ncbi:restriction endonuclease [Rasiella rasia]|uniref:Restriction endonuclease n=1 Tax=Rasiella rasia TaxID=2744027 RepID=A0A6G6GJF5_9FLAO|nr:restriction endonuclease [Rasiella rasia]QIE58705.1 restriction endonuclease [Rasiella rasia]